MKLISEPSIYHVGVSEPQYSQVVRYLDDHDMEWEPSDLTYPHYLTEVAGRVCYLSFGKGRNNNKDYMDNIIESKHGSVLEHVVFNFIFTGISRSFSHELVRHRAGMAYSQLSQRYVDEADCAFVIPPDFLVDPMEPVDPYKIQLKQQAYKLWAIQMEHALTTYAEMTTTLSELFQDIEDRTERRKRARQVARSVLPNSTETHIFASGNIRALRNVLEQRGSRFAETEMKRFAHKLLPVLQELAPNAFGDYEIKDGEIFTEHVKV